MGSLIYKEIAAKQEGGVMSELKKLATTMQEIESPFELGGEWIAKAIWKVKDESQNQEESG